MQSTIPSPPAKAQPSSACDAVVAAAAIADLVSRADPSWVPVAEVADFEETGRGMRATLDLNPGDTIIRIPESLLITRSVVYRHCPGFKQRPALDEHCALAMFLYVLACPSEVQARLGCNLNDFGAYRDSLPQAYDTMHYSAEEVLRQSSSFVPSHIKEKLEVQRSLIQSHTTLASTIFSKLDPSHAFSGPLFVQSWFACNTRCVSLPPGSQHSMALAPLLDMFNHSPSAKIQMSLSNGFYSLVTMDRWRAGEQVFIHYGDHDNWDLWIEYGFCIPGNTRAISVLDDLRLAFPTNGDPVTQERWSVLDSMGLVNDQALSLPASFALICSLHLLLLPKATPSESMIAKWKRMYYSGLVAQVADEGRYVAAFLKQVVKRKCELVNNLIANRSTSCHPSFAILLSDTKHLLQAADVGINS
ncbi:hypothetical protein BCR44DRAFT_64968 [Catenaria anguillulae PL171]|uniref:SET domain-containing protein n=1 Tax=Catenaria anguillulae PL171 TaxID=765915 RepID=A0A1Y2H6V9_9FUNG|nr:hypothetical protein BCR44DRAFT_64968 [Catenaria anguillulae PL171]